METNLPPQDSHPGPQSGSSAESSMPGSSPAPAPVQRIVIEQPGGLGRRIITRLLALGIGVSVLLNISQCGMYNSYFQSGQSIEERFYSGNKKARAKVAVIAIDGTILNGEGFVKAQIDRVSEDDDVEAVVVRVDSPGGTVTASNQIYHQLRRLADERQIPLVVSMGGMAASGGYYVSMAVGDQPDTIFAEPTTWTGSIGVIIPHYDLSGFLAEWKVKNDSIKSHPLKSIGSMSKEMTAQERAILQELVDDSFEQFKEIIKAGRPALREDEAALDKIATGQVFTTSQAIENGLVDREGFLQDAVDRAIALSGHSEDQVRVVRFNRPAGLGDLIGLPTADSATPGMSSLLELSTPRAYYIWTWLPPIGSSATAH